MSENQAIAQLFSEVGVNPRLYPHQLDLIRRGVLFLAFEEAEYRNASFLDERALTPQTQGAWYTLEQVETALERSPGPPRPVHFIFHMGHTGSTLLSRLLDAAGGVLGLREPLPLRTLAETSEWLGQSEALVSSEEFDRLIETFLHLWGRGFGSEVCTIIKATSFTTPVAGHLLAAAPSARAVCLTLKPEPYLATILAGANSAMDLRTFSPERMRRLVRMAGPVKTPLHKLSHGELAAMTWLTERLSHDAILNAATTGGRVREIDFEDFLASPAEKLSDVCDHFGLGQSDEQVQSILAGPVMGQYSKAVEHSYTPDTRLQVLTQSREQNEAEIGRGLDWLGRMGVGSDLARQVLSRFM